MPEPSRIEHRAGVRDSLSTTAAAEQLRSETRAFGNAAAKLNLQRATAAFLEAKKALFVQKSESSDPATTTE